MKCALVLTGHMRCWQTVFPNTKEKILDRWNPDIFISTWENEGYWTSPQNDPTGAGVNLNSPVLDFNGVFEAYQPKKFIINDSKDQNLNKRIDDMADSVREFAVEIRPRNIVSQYYLMAQALDNFDLSDYDYVIRMRPDLIINDDLPEFDKDSMYFINHPNHQGLGVGDMFTASNVQNYAWFYHKVVFEFHSWTMINKRFCPHMMFEDISKNISPLNHVLNIRKTIQHTPNGQYQDYKGENK